MNILLSIILKRKFSLLKIMIIVFNLANWLLFQ